MASLPHFRKHLHEIDELGSEVFEPKFGKAHVADRWVGPTWHTDGSSPLSIVEILGPDQSATVELFQANIRLTLTETKY